MTIYRFGHNSVIDQVAVRHSKGGGVRAYLHAREGVDPATLADIKEALTKNSMKWTPLSHDGKLTLEVRDIGRNGHRLLQFLAELGATTGTPQKEVNPENQVKFKDKLKNNLLRLSGALYSIGDIGFIFRGAKEAFISTKPSRLFKKDNLTATGLQDLLAGIFYAAGSPVITFFGRGDKSDVQLRHMSYDTLSFLEEKGAKVPQDASIRSVIWKHNANPWRKLKTKLERYPAEICNSLFGVAGVMMTWAGLKKARLIKSGKSHKSLFSAYTDVGLGISTILAGMVSLVEEEPRQPGEPRKTGMAGVWQFVKEKPLRMVGILLGVSTAGHTASALSSYRKAKNPPSGLSPAELQEIKNDGQGVWGHLLFASTNLAAEVAMSLSSKGHGEGVESDASLKPSMYAVMADLIERAPPDQRTNILELASSYLSREENLNLPQDEIKAGIAAQMEETRHNPWLGSLYTNAINKTVDETVPHSESEWQNMVAKISESTPTPAIVR